MSQCGNDWDEQERLGKSTTEMMECWKNRDEMRCDGCIGPIFACKTAAEIRSNGARRGLSNRNDEGPRKKLNPNDGKGCCFLLEANGA